MSERTTESSSVPARLKDFRDSLKDAVKNVLKERLFVGLLGIPRSRPDLLEDEQEVFLQVGKALWHAPRQLRAELWLSALARKDCLVSEYQNYLAQEITREAATDIDKDVQRTFPNTKRFHSEEGQAQLRNILRAYAAYDKEVAYCQGMNFVAGLLLMYLPSEAQAFAALVVLMEERGLRSFYDRNLALLQVQLWQLSRLISPRLTQHMEACGVVPMMYGASWLMTAFSADFPIPFSARIMDVLLGDQCECALLKVAVGIIKAVEERLLAMGDLEEMLELLKIEVPGWDEEELHALLTIAFTKPWTPRQLGILRSTEGVETVAQAMDRVMTMNVQQAQGADEDDGIEDGFADVRVAAAVPRLEPPPSFSASPACSTPVYCGGYGGSAGGASAALSPTATYKCGGAMGMGSSGGGTLGSPAAWSLPSVHPNQPASPAMQAFRRAHLPAIQAVAASAGGAVGGAGDRFPLTFVSMRSSRSILCKASHLVEGAGRVGASEAVPVPRPRSRGRSSTIGEPHFDAEACNCGALNCAADHNSGPGVGDEWGEFAAAARQWRALSRSTPGSMRLRRSEEHPPGHWHGQAIPVGGSPAAGSSPGSNEPNASHSISVPWAGSAPNAAATAMSRLASWRPPLPPRSASLDHPAGFTPFSRLSVVAEDPLAVQMGPVAPAPSPRGSMDMHVLGRSSSMGTPGAEGYEFGTLLAVATGMGTGGGACNADCSSGTGTASAATYGVLLSPSGFSGALSPHAGSPQVVGWAAGRTGSGPGAGMDTPPDSGYMALGVGRAGLTERAGSGPLLNEALAGQGASALPSGEVPLPGACSRSLSQSRPQQPADGPTDLAGDILRMLTAVETGAAHTAYDPRVTLGEAMYVDSPTKELFGLRRNVVVAKDHQGVVQHISEAQVAQAANAAEQQAAQAAQEAPAHAAQAAEDLARATEEAERMRQELQAQLLQQKGTCSHRRCSVTDAEPASDGSATESAALTGMPEGDARSQTVPWVGADAAGFSVEPVMDKPAGGGAEEFVLKRPVLYVDGIPMFDPKTLMAGVSSEAQVMFTPAVSPGASSYAGPPIGSGDAAAEASGGSEAAEPLRDAASEQGAVPAHCNTAAAAQEGTAAAPPCSSGADAFEVDWSRAPPIQPSGPVVVSRAASEGYAVSGPDEQPDEGEATLELPPLATADSNHVDDSGDDDATPYGPLHEEGTFGGEAEAEGDDAVAPLEAAASCASTLPASAPNRPLPGSFSSTNQGSVSHAQPVSHAGSFAVPGSGWYPLRCDSMASAYEGGSRMWSARWDLGSGDHSDSADNTPRHASIAGAAPDAAPSGSHCAQPPLLPTRFSGGAARALPGVEEQEDEAAAEAEPDRAGVAVPAAPEEDQDGQGALTPAASADPEAEAAAEASPSDATTPSVLDPALASAMRAAAAGSECEEDEGGAGGSSSLHRAVSPSLASHIMNAYLISAEHQQQQEQREREREAGEREAAAASAAMLAASTAPASVGGAGEEEAASSVSAHPPDNGAEAAGARDGAACISAATDSLLPPAPHTESDVSFQAMPAAPRPATPFALHLDTLAAQRLSAEVLQAMPPALQLQPPGTPTSPPHVSLAAGLGSTGGFGSPSVHSRRCTGNGEGEGEAHGLAHRAPASCGGELQAQGSHTGAAALAAQSTCGARPGSVSSSAVAPLLPPPPAPQLPLCSTLQKHEAMSAAAAAVAACAEAQGVAAAGSAAVSALQAADRSAALAAAHFPPQPPVPIGPTWTATFEGVEDVPSSAEVAMRQQQQQSPLPPVFSRDSAGGASGPEVHTPEPHVGSRLDMARGMSLDARQVPL